MMMCVADADHHDDEDDDNDDVADCDHYDDEYDDKGDPQENVTNYCSSGVGFSWCRYAVRCGVES